MRLDRFIAQCSDYSRSESRKLIRAGRVLVNDSLADRADIAIVDADIVTIDGDALSPLAPCYLMLNKPVGFECSHAAADHRSVFELLTNITELSYEPLQIVGRLDVDTSGLIFLTNDGQWNHRVTAPRVFGKKRYRFTLASPVSDAALQTVRKGLVLKGEVKPTLPAAVDMHSPTEGCIEIGEGRYHQVKRMFAAIGNRIESLHREGICGVELDPTLAPGDYRALTKDELNIIDQHLKVAKADG